MKLISLIVPVLNEEEAIPLFYDAVQDVLHDEPYDVEILFIDDGSTDRTLEIIEGLHARDPRVRGISFSRNFGKELALAAGLQAARGDAVVPMDVDLQTRRPCSNNSCAGGNKDMRWSSACVPAGMRTAGQSA